jgi:hypothetical protein
MNLKSHLFDRVRVKPPSREAQRLGQTICQFPGCSQAGDFLAPKGRFQEGQYFYFCLDHVREYNGNYNYFTGMSPEAIERFRRDDLVGHRPTWAVGTLGGAKGICGEQGGFYRANSRGGIYRTKFRGYCCERVEQRYGVAALRALDQLGLDDSVDMAVIRARYKDLVKRLHPDVNAGDRSNEDRLREIIRAYNYLKSVKQSEI